MSKRHDYTSTSDNHENFKRSSIIASWFNNADDKPYVVLIGTKLARLSSLLDNKEPKNESIEDSFLDLINYCALWMERRTYKPTIADLEEILNPKCAYCQMIVHDPNPNLTRLHQNKNVIFCSSEHLHKYFAGVVNP